MGIRLNYRCNFDPHFITDGCEGVSPTCFVPEHAGRESGARPSSCCVTNLSNVRSAIIVLLRKFNFEVRLQRGGGCLKRPEGKEVLMSMDIERKYRGLTQLFCKCFQKCLCLIVLYKAHDVTQLNFETLALNK